MTVLMCLAEGGGGAGRAESAPPLMGQQGQLTHMRQVAAALQMRGVTDLMCSA